MNHLPGYHVDGEYSYALYALAALEWPTKDLLPYLTSASATTGFQDGLRRLIEDPRLGSGQRMLARAALAICSRDPADRVDLRELGRMDPDQFQVVVHAAALLNGRRIESL